ncbi:BMP family protein [Kocuria sp.]|uniref:BMP family lipoprotein n=1 Tax=Kocuria sp. TaxID=1871328 RepID=UPI0026DC96CE|nr:BMP family ABC transporter substrate-binding protein [Kocuria sp.]MDO4919339.1 BMP family ABC transporter substrate-binding protein [Kocuria sp.]
MTTRRLLRPGALALAGITGLALAGCGVAPGGSGESSSQAPDFKGCIVSDAGGFQDRSFNQGAHDGLEAAEEHEGIEVEQAESQSETDFEPNLASMVQRGCTLTVSVGSLLADATGKAAAADPDRHFAIVDDGSITADNVKPIVYNTAEAAFLAGYLAAGTSKTGRVGTYGGMDIPAVTVFMDGFADGVEHYNQKKRKDVKVLGWNKGSRKGTFLNSFQDSSRARTVTRSLVDDGADVVLPVAGEAAQGTADAVTEANKDGGDDPVRLIWPDTDGYDTLDSGRQYLLTSVLKDVARSVEDVVTQAAGGSFDNTKYVGTLQNGGVGLAPYHDQQDEVGEDLDRQVQQLKQDIVDGRVTVQSRSAPKP